LVFVGPAGGGGLQGVENHRGGVRTRLLRDDRHPVALAPSLQLLDRCGPKGVARGEHDTVALTLEPLGQLPDRRGFAGPVHAHHEDDLGTSSCRRANRGVAAAQNIHQLAPEGAK